MRLRGSLAPFIVWVVCVLGLGAIVAAVVTIGLWLGRADAATATRCPPPDPNARPIVALSRGEVRDLAALAWAEARGEPDAYCSMQAVAAVVVNRIRTNPRYFGATVTQVISRPYAFSPFGRDDPQNKRMRSVDERDSLYLSALLAALAALSGADPTRRGESDGATHFYSGAAPEWSHRLLVTARIGNHVFLREP
jgi:spore germination cell wall hydrolase CwlJ-like protein